MSGPFCRPDVRRCRAAPAFELSPVLHSRMCRARTVSAPLLRPPAHGMYRRTAAKEVLRPHFDVQGARRQRAAPAALARPWQRCALRARLAAGRSRERMREAKTEGKRKGPARLRPPTQSARGLDTAPRLPRRVLRVSRCAPAAGGLRVPFPMHCALMRWRLRHGIR